MSDIRGDRGDNKLDGTSGDDTIHGYAGNDTIDGGDGDDDLFGGAGADLIVIGSGYDRDRLVGGAGDDTLMGGAYGEKTLVGGGGDDLLFGGGGSGRLKGGAGADQFIFGVHFHGVVSVDDLSHNDLIDLTAMHVDSLAEVRAIAEQSGEDVVISGGDRYDQIIIRGHTLAQMKNGWFRFDTSTTGHTVSYTDVSAMLFGGAGDDQVIGSYLNDTLFGGRGDDVISPGGGADIVTGGPGDDVVRYTQGNFGVDRITDFSHRDNVDLSGLHIDSFRELKPYLTASGADAELDFGAFGAIDFAGRSPGEITASWFTFDTSTAPLDLAGKSHNDLLFGGAGDATLKGAGGSDTLVGGAGDDLLIGGAASDVLTGGRGADIFSYAPMGGLYSDNGTDTITDFRKDDRIDLSAYRVDSLAELRPLLQDTASGALIQLYPGREGILLQGHSLADIKSDWFIFDTSTASTTVNGGDFSSDLLFGGAGENRVNGWTGYDTLYGGQGDDTLQGSRGNDRLTGGPGRDVFRYVQGENDKGWDSDTITDFSKGDRIGFAGIHVGDLAQLSPYIHQSGSDVVIEFGHNGGVEDIDIQNQDLADVTGRWFQFVHTTEGFLTSGYKGREVLFGAAGNDTIFGEGGADSIDAGAGDDRIVGGAGVDHLIGGKGADTFAYRDGDLLGPGAREVIGDFSTRQHDRIDVSGMDADTTVAGDQAFTVVAGDFTAPGQISIVEEARGDWLVEFNTNADLKADHVLEVMSAARPTAADFVL